MSYALIENGIVTNLIYLHPKNADKFPNAIPIHDIPVAIGDTYINNSFYRNGEKVLTPTEEYELIITELDIALLDSTYQNILGSIE